MVEMWCRRSRWSLHVVWLEQNANRLNLRTLPLQHTITIMPLQLPPPLQFALHTTRPLQVPSDPPTADDVVRAALNAELVWGTHSLYHSVA